jgi:hypothetical protein
MSIICNSDTLKEHNYHSNFFFYENTILPPMQR